MSTNKVLLNQKPVVLTANSGDQVVLITNPNSNTVGISLIDVSNLYSNLTITFGVQETPANSTVTVAQGTLFFDTDFLYVAVANNILRRIPLQSF